MESDQGLLQWLSNVDKFGIGFVKDVPTSKTKTKGLASRISHFRTTHYGSFWDFTANMKHGDTAYSTMALPAHNDTTYFTDPIGLQFFHLVKHVGEGGKSLYVDGFNVALQLRELHPWAFDALTKLRISAHAAGISLLFHL
jgi:trimethyllysine dioxygenase